MKINHSTASICSVFGHNYYRPKSQMTTNTKLICSTCKAISQIDINGDFDEFPYSNLELRKTLRRLFVLNSKYRIQSA
jgi:hypothetical protein